MATSTRPRARKPPAEKSSARNPGRSNEAVSISPDRPTRTFELVFGLVSVPVALKPLGASRNGGIKGTTCCAEHHAKVAQRWECPVDGSIMTKAETVTGYETEPKSGQYVVIDEADVDAIEADRSKSVPVTQTVHIERLDPAYIESVYVCWPGDEAGAERFDLFAGALRDLKRVALVHAVISKKMRLLAFLWSEQLGCLLAYVCRFESDLRWNDIEIIRRGFEARGEPDPKMLELASTMLSQLDGDFDPGEVEDTYQNALRELVDAARSGRKPSATATSKPAEQKKQDLLAALQASVDTNKRKRKAAK